MRQVLLAKFAKSDRAHEERYLASEELANITSLFFLQCRTRDFAHSGIDVTNGQSNRAWFDPNLCAKINLNPVAGN